MYLGRLGETQEDDVASLISLTSEEYILKYLNFIAISIYNSNLQLALP